MYDFVIRLDANKKVGAGHLVRSLSLVEYLLSEGQLIAFVGDIEQDIFKAIVKRHIHFFQSSERPECRCLIVDHYSPLPKLLDGWPISLPVVLFEDLPERASERPVMVINALGNLLQLKARFPNANIVCGLNFQLYRTAVRNLHARQHSTQLRHRVADQAIRILVSFGGSDQSLLIIRVLETIQAFGLSKVAIDVVGECNIPQALATNVTYHGAFVDDFLIRACQSDIVVCGAGQTLLEMLYLKCFVLGVVVAENQLRCAELVNTMGCPVVKDLANLERALEEVLSKYFRLDNRSGDSLAQQNRVTRQTHAQGEIGSDAELLVKQILACKI